MKNYQIANKAEIDRFIQSSLQRSLVVKAIKGRAPIGALYLDGDLIQRPVNIAWENSNGESVTIIYQSKDS